MKIGSSKNDKYSSDQSNKSGKETPWWQPGMVMFARLSGWIAFPVIGALFLGKWLDKRYDTEPWLLLATVGLAFVVTSIGIAKEATKSFKEIEEQAKKEKKDKESK